MALILHRAMRLRLKQAGNDLSPEAALAKLRRIQRHKPAPAPGQSVQKDH